MRSRPNPIPDRTPTGRMSRRDLARRNGERGPGTVATRSATALAIVLLATASLPAAAQEVYGGYHGGGYGYAGELVRGTYIGAPLTRTPRPSRLVPTPWSYGTYGVPTVSGLPATPAAQPVITVINGRSAGSASPADGSTGARIVEVRVPRR